jgi:RNA polymerase sigma-70 factor (ECF subfamily)
MTLLQTIFPKTVRWPLPNLALIIRRFASKTDTNSNLSEASEIRGLNDFDPETITQIHTKYYPHVYRYAKYRLSNDTLAEDLASESFIRLLDAAKRRKGPNKTIRGWLMGTISNLVNEHYRKAYQNPEEPIPVGFMSKEPSPTEIMERNEAREQLQQVLASLTEEQQHVLALRFGNQFSLKETAQIMKKNVNAIKALQFRALAAMRNGLETIRNA